MIRRESKFTKNAFWWGCSNYPDCRYTSAEHPDGSMMSTPADKPLKELRQKAHKKLEDIFGEWYSKDAKKQMYDWLSAHTEKGHIGMMNETEVKEVLIKLAAK